jgi:1-acyl-sn-glycerol-3-phosphate acyltransferase
MRGHENAYNLAWPPTRRGFAKVAIKAGVPILPVFYQNCEEMRWNPVLWFWNKLHYGSKIYDTLASTVQYKSCYAVHPLIKRRLMAFRAWV